MMDVISCNYSDIAHLKSSPYRGGASFDEKVNQRWYKAIVGGEFLGCTSLILIGKHRARVASIFIDPKYRGQGYGAALLQFCITEAGALGYSILDARSKEHHLFLGAGFTAGQTYKEGSTAYERPL